jgi:predicted Fe-S protein YdhL (DUF1289 family)
VDRQQPILSLKSLREAFEKSDKVTISKFEFDALMEVIDPALKASSELLMLRMEIKRIRKVATPAWKACERVSKQMSRRGCKADERKIREWKFILDDARIVYWSDLPQRSRHRWREFTRM